LKIIQRTFRSLFFKFFFKIFVFKTTQRWKEFDFVFF